MKRLKIIAIKERIILERNLKKRKRNPYIIIFSNDLSEISNQYIKENTDDEQYGIKYHIRQFERKMNLKFDDL